MSDADEVSRVVASMCPMLAGRPPQVQGAALADLLATWITGHIIPGKPSETEALREQIMEMHVEMVRELVSVNAARLWAETETK
jgi:hypothetical protein